MEEGRSAPPYRNEITAPHLVKIGGTTSLSRPQRVSQPRQIHIIFLTPVAARRPGFFIHETGDLDMLPLAIPVAEIVIGAAVGAVVASLTPERVNIDIKFKA